VGRSREAGHNDNAVQYRFLPLPGDAKFVARLHARGALRCALDRRRMTLPNPQNMPFGMLAGER